MSSYIPIIYVVITRDRPGDVPDCLLALQAMHCMAFPDSAPLVYIVDDSTTHESRALLRSNIAKMSQHNIRLNILSISQYFSLRTALQRRSHSADELFNLLCPPLGMPRWNIFGARNFAWLYIAHHTHDNTLIVMLDDDVICAPHNYRGLSFVPTAAHTIRVAHDLLHMHTKFAVGPSLIGREDVSLARHALKAVFAARGMVSATSGFPYFIATCLSDLDRPHPVPSGGMLITTTETIRIMPLLPFYNEDWIWARLLSADKTIYVTRLDSFCSPRT